MKETTVVEVEGKTLSLSNLSKLMYPESGFTKSHMIDYYIRIAPVLLPHLKNRPITLKRYPDGINAEYFYEKRAPSHTPDWVKTAVVERSGDKPAITAILINDLPTLIWSANLANLELHTPLACVPALETPTMVVFDLDPGAPADVLDCGQVALWLKEIFDSLKLQCFVKTSGSKGMQLYVPLNTPVDYEQTRGFAKSIADWMRREHPDRVVVEMKKQLRTGKVFIDYSQNAGRKTTVCVYSLRATHQTPNVSTPVTWEEITKAIRKGDPQMLFFTPEGVLKRVKNHGDLFAPLLEVKHRLPRTTGDRKGTSLRAYHAKRDFKQTSEPPPSLAKSKTGNLFVIQKHRASHLHYDFRLEMEGVLRSWAVPKGIPTEKEDKRLAMHVEDHPLEYAKFEGIIPKGNYGAGTVMVWDIGTYTVKDQEPGDAYRSRKITVTLHGKKLKGDWAVFAIGKKGTEDRSWLLMKKTESIPPISDKEDDHSALTGRTMEKIAQDHDAEWISNRPDTSKSIPEEFLKRIESFPSGDQRFVDPMQSKPVEGLPKGKEWLYEVKLDGYRALAVKRPGRYELISRNNKDLGKKYPEILEALRDVPGDRFVLDGEIVILDEKGLPSFQMLESYTPQSESYLCYYAFDLLHLNGKDLRKMPLIERKEILESMIPGDTIRYSVGLDADPDVIAREIRKRGLEGIVAKRKNSVYEAGRRSGGWVKFKIRNGQEFVIGGYKPSGKKNDFEWLVVGYYDGKRLLYASKVRAGFTPAAKRDLAARFAKLFSGNCPFANLPESQKGRWSEGFTKEDMDACVWLKPQLVCRVYFTEWTGSAHLRHPQFVALESDRNPKKVVRES